MFPDLADELGNSAPIAVASRIVEGLDVVGGLVRIGLQRTKINMWSVQNVQHTQLRRHGLGHGMGGLSTAPGKSTLTAILRYLGQCQYLGEDENQFY